MIFEINNTTISYNQEDESMVVTLADLDKEDGTGRAEDGEAFRETIRKGVRTIDVTWMNLSQSESSTIIDSCQSDDFYPVKYLDPKDGIITRTFYHGDITSTLLEYNNDNDIKWQLTTQFVEK